ncbi:hypothetical protein KC336_g28 [Hortaea werneckii]|nr:hypothetical protein KC336_g28 [Hortaea werneckii]
MINIKVSRYVEKIKVKEEEKAKIDNLVMPQQCSAIYHTSSLSDLSYSAQGLRSRLSIQCSLRQEFGFLILFPADVPEFHADVELVKRLDLSFQLSEECGIRHWTPFALGVVVETPFEHALGHGLDEVGGIGLDDYTTELAHWSGTPPFTAEVCVEQPQEPGTLEAFECRTKLGLLLGLDTVGEHHTLVPRVIVAVEEDAVAGLCVRSFLTFASSINSNNDSVNVSLLFVVNTILILLS